MDTQQGGLPGQFVEDSRHTAEGRQGNLCQTLGTQQRTDRAIRGGLWAHTNVGPPQVLAASGSHRRVYKVGTKGSSSVWKAAQAIQKYKSEEFLCPESSTQSILNYQSQQF